jgi:hypothetical protein
MRDWRLGPRVWVACVGASPSGSGTGVLDPCIPARLTTTPLSDAPPPPHQRLRSLQSRCPPHARPACSISGAADTAARGYPHEAVHRLPTPCASFCHGGGRGCTHTGYPHHALPSMGILWLACWCTAGPDMVHGWAGHGVRRRLGRTTRLGATASCTDTVSQSSLRPPAYGIPV